MPENWIGPDLFGFYKHEIIDLLTHDDGLPAGDKDTASVPPRARENGAAASPSGDVPLFGDSLEHAVPEATRGLLRSSLRQSARALSEEVGEMVDPVIRIRRIMALLKSKRQNFGAEAPQDRDSTSLPRKKQKISSSNAERGSSKEQHRDADEETEINESLKFLLESNNSLQLEDTITRHSDELDAVLKYMEDQLEELLDAVVLKCRVMTRQEKRHLCNLIKNLPPKNLNRIADIIERAKPSDAPSKEIFVELEDLGNQTLWRLYFYVKAVENARKLAT